MFCIYILTTITGWWFTTSHLLSTPSIKDCLFHSNIVFLYFKLFYNYPLTIQFVLRLHDYFQERNVLNMFVIVIVFLFISSWREPHKWQKHVAVYPVITLHKNANGHLLVMLLHSFALCMEYEPCKIEVMLTGQLHFYSVCSCYIAFFFRILMLVVTYMSLFV